MPDAATQPSAGSAPSQPSELSLTIRGSSSSADPSVQDLIRQEADRAGIPPALALAVAEQESSFNPTVLGPKLPDGSRAIGTFQILPSTAKTLGIDPNDPRQNIAGGVKYLRQLLDQYNGDTTSVLRSYGGIKQSTIPYVQQVTARMNKFAADPTLDSSSGRSAAPGSQPASARTAAQPPSSPGGAQAPAGPAQVTPVEQPPSTMLGTAMDIGKSIVEGFDPRTQQGRENLAAGAGEAAGLGLAASAVGAPEIGVPLTLTARLAGVLLPALGAATAAGGENVAEQAASGQIDPWEALTRGGTQGLYSVGSHFLLMPIRSAARGLLGPRVARATGEALQGELEAARTEGASTIARLKSQLDSTLATIKEDAQTRLDALKTAGTQAIRGARATAKSALADAELRASEGVASATRMLDDLRNVPPSAISSATAIKAAVTGPVKRALDAAGDAVGSAAQKLGDSGVMVPLQDTKEALLDMVQRARPEFLFGAAPASKETATQTLLSNLKTNLLAGAQRSLQAGTMSAEDLIAFNQRVAQGFGLDPTKMHPDLPGVIGKILDAPDELPFDEAHAAKRIFDESVNWDRTAKKHMEQLTKAVRGSLRSAMDTVDDGSYRAATSTFQNLATLYRKGVGQRIMRLAQTDAGAGQVAKLLKDSDPISTDSIKRLLVDQAAAGGQLDLGRRAWDAVRSHFTYDTLIAPGIDKLEGTLDKLITTRPEFVRTVFGDGNGAAVLANLSKISEAYKTANTIGDELVARAKQVGTEGVQRASDLAAQTTLGARRDIAKQTAAATAAGKSEMERAAGATKAAVTGVKKTAKAFSESTVAKSIKRTPNDIAADVARVAGLNPLHSIWGAQSLLRLLHGPSASDMLQWAAYSTPNTQRLVKMLTSRVPTLALSNFIRDMVGSIAGSETTPIAVEPPSAAPSTTTTPAPPQEPQ